MDKRHKELLRKHRLWLSEQLLVSETIVQFLYQEDILTQVQVEEIECQSSSKQRVLKLLDILPVRGPRAFQVFLQSLDEFSWVRDTLQRDLDCQPGPGLGSADDVCISEHTLQRVPTDRQLSRIADLLGGQWEAVLLDLELTTEDLYRCRADHQLDMHGAVLEGLVQWKRAQGKKATVQRLIKSLEAADIHTSMLLDALH
ncbi:death domain-containing protein CRADD [Periophthalmus magnuspinnatus]|uniref:death domain-containing protein CRADD n=1 Tax=Periophthalmus magnuspinnatus TaxID=409849 RepID=UPI00145B2A1E|nr:death domain-containing protein CRADD [Periophthalmus magnuspinnatus]